METQNIDRRIAKQLTPTEIGIAVAEIRDRFMRYLSAAYECHHSEPIKEELEVRVKYEIPTEVALMSEISWKPSTATLTRVSPILRDWVNGRLTEDEAHHMLWYFQEVNEVDYGWIFMGEPMGFYCEGVSPEHIEAMDQKFIRIGTRFHKKRTGKPIKQTLPFF